MYVLKDFMCLLHMYVYKVCINQIHSLRVMQVVLVLADVVINHK